MLVFNYLECIYISDFNRQDIIGNWTSSASTEYYSMPRNVKVTYIYTF